MCVCVCVCVCVRARARSVLFLRERLVFGGDARCVDVARNKEEVTHFVALYVFDTVAAALSLCWSLILSLSLCWSLKLWLLLAPSFSAARHFVAQ